MVSTSTTCVIAVECTCIIARDYRKAADATPYCFTFVEKGLTDCGSDTGDEGAAAVAAATAADAVAEVAERAAAEAIPLQQQGTY